MSQERKSFISNDTIYLVRLVIDNSLDYIQKIIIQTKQDKGREWHKSEEFDFFTAFVAAITTKNVKVAKLFLDEGFAYSDAIPKLVKLAAFHDASEILDLFFERRARIDDAIIATEIFFNQLLKTCSPEEENNIKLDYRRTIKNILDFAIGFDFCNFGPRNRALSFLKKIDLKYFNFIGISVDGMPLTREFLLKYNITTGVDKAIFSMFDLQLIDDAKRRGALSKRLEMAFKKQGKLIDKNGIVNLAPIWRAANRGDSKAVAARINAGISPNDCNDSYCTDISGMEPVVSAAQNGHLEIVKMLIEHAKFEPRYVFDALLVAENNEHFDIADILISKCGHVLDCVGNTLLHLAVEKKHVKLIKRLLQNGAYVNKVGSRISSLELAAKGDIEIFKLLLPHADKAPNAHYPWYIKIMFACCDSPDCIENLKLLKAQGADLNSKNEDNERLFDHVMYVLVCIDVTLAKRYSYLKLLNFLFENGVDPNVKDVDGNTAIHRFVPHAMSVDIRKEYHYIYEEVIDCCLRNGYKINLPGEHGRILLHMAAEARDPYWFKYLLTMGADINALDDTKCTPLDMAKPTYNSKREEVYKLIFHGIAVHHMARITEKMRNEVDSTLSALTLLAKPLRKLVTDYCAEYNPEDVKDVESIIKNPDLCIFSIEKLNEYLSYLNTIATHLPNEAYIILNDLNLRRTYFSCCDYKKHPENLLNLAITHSGIAKLVLQDPNLQNKLLDDPKSGLANLEVIMKCYHKNSEIIELCKKICTQRGMTQLLPVPKVEINDKDLEPVVSRITSHQFGMFANASARENTEHKIFNGCSNSCIIN